MKKLAKLYTNIIGILLDEETDKFAKEVTKQSLNIIEIGKKQFYEQINMQDFAARRLKKEIVEFPVKNKQNFL